MYASSWSVSLCGSSVPPGSAAPPPRLQAGQAAPAAEDRRWSAGTATMMMMMPPMPPPALPPGIGIGIAAAAERAAEAPAGRPLSAPVLDLVEAGVALPLHGLVAPLEHTGSRSVPRRARRSASHRVTGSLQRHRAVRDQAFTRPRAAARRDIEDQAVDGDPPQQLVAAQQLDLRDARSPRGPRRLRTRWPMSSASHADRCREALAERRLVGAEQPASGVLDDDDLVGAHRAAG